MMKVGLQEIKKESRTSFSILWGDGKRQQYLLYQLQRACPCSACRDQVTGKFMKNPQEIPEDLEAVSLQIVGNYALRLQFASGCSFGIYTFELLKKIGKIC